MRLTVIAAMLAWFLVGVALTLTVVVTASSGLTEALKYAPLAQPIVSAGLLLVALASLFWAVQTFSQRERHEAAKEQVNYALQINYVDPTQVFPPLVNGQSGLPSGGHEMRFWIEFRAATFV